MKKIILYLIFSIIIVKGYAQNNLTGTVKNSKGNTPLAGVTVAIPDLKIGAITDANGNYVFHNIPAGSYIITVSFIGYASEYKEVNTAENHVIDFVLSLSNKEMNEVVITGVSSATEQKSSPIPISVVSRNDILQNGSANIIDALQNTPGVSQITEGPAISKPVIRGLGYNRVVVMNDGVRQEGQQWGDEFGIEVDDYSVDKVEILRGPASLSYGSDAMAGVINFLPAPTLPEGQIKGSILANYQTNNGLIGGSANLAGNIKGIAWDIRYSNKVAHFYQNPHDGYVWNSGYSQSNFKGTVGINRKWGYSRLTASMFDLRLGIIEGARDSASNKFTTHHLTGQNTDSAVIAPDNKNTTYNYFPIIHQHVTHNKLVWDNSIALGEGRLGIRLGWQQNYRREANDITQGDIYNNYFYLQTLNYDVRYILPERNHFELSIGANGMQQHSEDRGTAFLTPEYHNFDIGGFAIAKKSFNRLSISGGVRYDTRVFKGDDMYIDTTGLAAGTNPTGKKISGPTDNSYHRFTAYTSNFSGISASAGATYDITKSFYVKANIARGYRAPNISESGADGIHDGTPFYEIGVHDLKPETSLQGDLTAGYNSEDISIEATAFINNIQNYIFPEKLAAKHGGGDSMRTDILSGLPAGQTFKYTQGTAMLSGMEAIFNIHPAGIKWLHFNNSFSMVTAIQKNYGLRQSAYDSIKYLPFTPPYKYHGELMAKFNTLSKLFKQSYIKAGVDYLFKQSNVFYKYGFETPTPAYMLFSAGLGTDVCNGKGQTLFSVYVYGTNLGNLAYLNSMSRLKYAMTYANGTTQGVYEMGRTIGFKLLVPIGIKK